MNVFEIQFSEKGTERKKSSENTLIENISIKRVSDG